MAWRTHAQGLGIWRTRTNTYVEAIPVLKKYLQLR